MIGNHISATVSLYRESYTLEKRCRLAVSKLLVKVKNYPEVSTRLYVYVCLAAVGLQQLVYSRWLVAAGLQQLVYSSWFVVAGL